MQVLHLERTYSRLNDCRLSGDGSALAVRRVRDFARYGRCANMPIRRWPIRCFRPLLSGDYKHGEFPEDVNPQRFESDRFKMKEKRCKLVPAFIQHSFSLRIYFKNAL